MTIGLANTHAKNREGRAGKRRKHKAEPKEIRKRVRRRTKMKAESQRKTRGKKESVRKLRENDSNPRKEVTHCTRKGHRSRYQTDLDLLKKVDLVQQIDHFRAHQLHTQKQAHFESLRVWSDMNRWRGSKDRKRRHITDKRELKTPPSRVESESNQSRSEHLTHEVARGLIERGQEGVEGETREADETRVHRGHRRRRTRSALVKHAPFAEKIACFQRKRREGLKSESP